jgi:hypothetical protein
MDIRQLETHVWYGQMSRLHALPYIGNSLRFENNQASLQSRKPGSNSEKQGMFCDILNSNIAVQYAVGPICSSPN